MGALLMVNVATNTPSTRSFEGEPISRLMSLSFPSVPSFGGDGFNMAWPSIVRTRVPFRCSAVNLDSEGLPLVNSFIFSINFSNINFNSDKVFMLASIVARTIDILPFKTS